MGYVLPGWLDEILDFIGINWPNVDEDDYREMADAMREFAEKFEGHGGEAHAAVNRILASSEGYAVDALKDHWGKVKGSHLDKVPEVSRLFATACDVVADIVYGMKIKCEVELGAMAASIGIGIGLSVVTGGLSALIGAAETAAMRELIRRIIKEAEEEIVARLLAEVTEPVTGKLEKMTEDMILDLADDAIHLPPGDGGGGDAGGGDGGGGGHDGGGHGGMKLASADGPSTGGGGGPGGGPGGGGRMRIDPDEFDNGAEKLSRHGSDLHTNSLAPLGRAKGAFGRTKGRDPFTQAFDSVLHGALDGSEKALKKVAKHVGEGVPGGVRSMAKRHRDNERGVVDDLSGIGKGRDGGGPSGPRSKSHTPAGKQSSGSSDKPADAQLSSKAREGRDKTTCGDPIDMATGDMVLAEADLVLPGVLPLVIERTHISGYRNGRFFGPSWASMLDERLELADDRGQLWWHQADGASKRYPYAPDLLGETVMPREGRRIPLTRVASRSSGATWDLAITDPRTGIVRRYLPTDDSGGTTGARTSVWWLAEIEDRNGNTVALDRDHDGLPIAVRHSGGYHVNVHVDEERRSITGLALRDQDGTDITVTAYRHDAAGDLAQVVNSSGLPMTFTYDDEHRVTAWTNRLGSVYRYVYDGDGRVIETVGPDGYLSATISYGELGAEGLRTTRYTDATGATTTFVINRLGQTVAETDPLGRTTHTTWSRWDQVLSRTDALGRTTRYERDDQGDVTAVEYADGARTDITYDLSLHLPTLIVQPDGARWQQEYDPRGNLLAQTAPDGAVTRYTFTRRGAQESSTNALGATTHFESSAAGLPLAVTDPLGAESRCERDAFGRIISLTDPLGGVLHASWTVEGLPTQRVSPDGTTEQWEWDAEGNCTGYTDANGSRTTYGYGHFGRLTSRTGPGGAEYSFVYDSELRLTQVTAPGDLTWEYRYDAEGQLLSETDFDGRVITYGYDAAGQLAERTTPVGERIAYERDQRGQIVGKDVAGALTTYSYDPAGRLLTARSGGCRLAYEYDAVGRILAETVNGRSTRSTYDAAGRRTTRTTASGRVSTYVYDPAGNRTLLSMGHSPDSSGHTLEFAFDALGREITRTAPDGGLRIDSAWNPSGRLARQAARARQGSLWDRTYDYRADGYLTSWHDHVNGTGRRLELDPVGRPLSVSADGWTEQYAYDGHGNQIEGTWPTGFPEAEAGTRTYTGTRIRKAGRTTYVYDDAGRLVERRRTRISKKPDVWRYDWDGEDRLTSCVTPDGETWTYEYDPLGRRIRKQRKADGLHPGTAVDFTWDGTRLAEQYDASTRTTLTWDHDGQRPLVQHEMKHLLNGEEATRSFAVATDLAGSPTELVTPGGEIAWQARPTVWGVASWNRDATAYTPLRFAGQYADPETGLHYNYFRHYDPATGRYATPDPLGLEAAPNPVSYVDNPQGWTDPLGLTRTSNQCEDELLSGVKKEADRASGVTPGRMRPAVSEGFQTKDGDIFTASSRRGTPPTLHPDVQEVLDGIPPGERGRGHGQCGLPQAVSEALTQGKDPNGAVGAAMSVRSSTTHEKHGALVPPCDSCRVLANHYQMEFLS
ncbi:RHS repeat-associated protein [Streptomyces sp. Amel2xB2]|uniref:DUF6531 domain-containing protein n=1 Tax=Streptomyces sp. Amel2xB2 TaxID=1305829 RepID=UPI000DBA65C9|nr:DUF6531 domain-containing protein [Streptomyces sp. Amel2xB2]RAJ61781.1 RHS repeat-associated protein [Streptomyces sp. Amel2xB2]